jgi:hypothetical protein
MRRSTIPWLLLTAGAAVYWTVALGVGLPSLGRALGMEHDRGYLRAHSADGCTTTELIDGRWVTFGDCFNVRFVHDAPDSTRARVRSGGQAGTALDVDTPTWQTAAPEPAPEEQDPIGRTAY